MICRPTQHARALNRMETCAALYSFYYTPVLSCTADFITGVHLISA